MVAVGRLTRLGRFSGGPRLRSPDRIAALRYLASPADKCEWVLRALHGLNAQRSHGRVRNPAVPTSLWSPSNRVRTDLLEERGLSEAAVFAGADEAVGAYFARFDYRIFHECSQSGGRPDTHGCGHSV